MSLFGKLSQMVTSDQTRQFMQAAGNYVQEKMTSSVHGDTRETRHAVREGGEIVYEWI